MTWFTGRICILAVFGLSIFGTASATIESPLAFKITKGATGATSYLFGSYHYGVSVDDMPAAFLRLQETTSVHAYEINGVQLGRLLAQLNKDPDHAVAEILKMQGSDPNRKGDFSPKEIDQLVSVGIPAAVARVMTDDACDFFKYRKYIFGPRVSILDEGLQERTQRIGKTLVELDSQSLRATADQKAKEKGFNHKCSIKRYLRNPTELKKLDDSVAAHIQAYKDLKPGDLLGLDDYQDPGTAVRNQAWLPTLESILSSGGSAFICVGVAHLVGPHGLIQLLTDSGYTIEIWRP